MKKTPPCWTVLDEKENPVHIEHARRNTPYFCPDCGGKMIPKMGDVKAHHFAHKPNEDGSEVSCGGEGYRHFRVKTFAHMMLSSVARHKFAYDLQFVMEKAQGQDIPDISVLKNFGNDEPLNQEILAIEIVDTHPPSDEKRARWKNMMLEIAITDWNDVLIGNAAKLSGALIPWLCGFQAFVDTLQDESEKTSIALERMTSLRLERVEKLEAEIEAELALMKTNAKSQNLNSLVQSVHPAVWFGSFASIPQEHQIHIPKREYEYEKKKNVEWGVSIKSSRSSSPKPGDWVWIKKKDGSFQHGILGVKFEEKQWLNDEYETMHLYKHHLVGRPLNSPEFQELLKNYDQI